MARVVSMPTGRLPTEPATQPALSGYPKAEHASCPRGGEDRCVPETAPSMESASSSVDPGSLAVIVGLQTNY